LLAFRNLQSRRSEKHRNLDKRGYEHGKRGNTVLGAQRLMADADKLAKYCVKNEDMPAMRAFETILSSPEQCIPAAFWACMRCLVTAL
jgi:hypothetical protein